MKPDGNAMANEIHAANSPSDASEVGSDNSGASFTRHWVHRSSISWGTPVLRCVRTYHPHIKFINSTTHHTSMNKEINITFRTDLNRNHVSLDVKKNDV
jgi:hypothetical protein